MTHYCGRCKKPLPSANASGCPHCGIHLVGTTQASYKEKSEIRAKEQAELSRKWEIQRRKVLGELWDKNRPKEIQREHKMDLG